MLYDQLLNEIHKLNRMDKLRIIQALANDLAVEEETLLKSGAHYEVWSPFDAAGAAEALGKLLEEAKNKNNG
jgi:hypothetical protein